VNSGTGEYGFDIKLTGTSNPGGQQLCVDVGDGVEWMLNGCVPFPYAANRWYYLAMTVSASTNTVIAYENQFHATGTLTNFGRSPLLFDSLHPLTVGGNPRFDGPPNTPENFDGVVGQVAIYKRALTGAQTLAHYKAGVAA
jgi:hypothetical protein